MCLARMLRSGKRPIHRSHSVEQPTTFELVVNVSCLMHAQAYLADSSIGRDLQQNEGVKVMCVRGNRIDKAESRQVAGRASLYCASAHGSPLPEPDRRGGGASTHVQRCVPLGVY